MGGQGGEETSSLFGKIGKLRIKKEDSIGDKFDEKVFQASQKKREENALKGTRVS